jgi:inward rectifier potassium channel
MSQPPPPPDQPPAAPGRTTLAEALRRGEARMQVRSRGEGARALDLYHRLMRAKPLTWAGTAGLAFVLFNLAFAGLYALDPQGLSSPGEVSGVPLFWRCFFFSVHTVATVGYGNVYPVSLWANWVVVAEITLGLAFFGVLTGMAFARFSRPRARIAFSQRAIVRDVDGVPMMMLRAANQRHNMIFSAEARLSVLVEEMVGGVPMRRFYDLDLVRNSNPTFALTWTLMHTLDAASPLAPLLASKKPFEIIALVWGVDEVSGHTIHGRWAYDPDDLHHGARFADMVERDRHGGWMIDYDRFHETVALD